MRKSQSVKSELNPWPQPEFLQLAAAGIRCIPTITLVNQFEARKFQLKTLMAALCHFTRLTVIISLLTISIFAVLNAILSRQYQVQRDTFLH